MAPAHISFHSFLALVWLSCPSLHSSSHMLDTVRCWRLKDGMCFKREPQLRYPGSALKHQCHLLIRAWRGGREHEPARGSMITDPPSPQRSSPAVKAWRLNRGLPGTQWGTDQRGEKCKGKRMRTMACSGKQTSLWVYINKAVSRSRQDRQDGIRESFTHTEGSSFILQREPRTNFEQGRHNIRFVTKFTLKATWRVDHNGENEGRAHRSGEGESDFSLSLVWFEVPMDTQWIQCWLHRAWSSGEVFRLPACAVSWVEY